MLYVLSVIAAARSLGEIHLATLATLRSSGIVGPDLDGRGLAAFAEKESPSYFGSDSR